MATSKTAGCFWRFGFVVVFLWLAWALCQDLTRPWSDQVDFNGTVWSQAAHNFLRNGILSTWGMPAAFYTGPTPIPSDGLYLHHPPLLPIWVAGMFRLFGEAEWVARLVPIFCSLVSLVLLWRIVADELGTRAATLTAALFATLPMELYYGRMVNFEPVVLMWMLAMFPCLRRWQIGRKRHWLALFFMFAWLSLWTAWMGYFLVAAVAVSFLITRREGETKLAVGLMLLMLASGAGFLAQIRLAHPEAFADIVQAVERRLGSRIDVKHEATFVLWVKRIFESWMSHILPISWIIAMGGVVVAWRGRRRDGAMSWTEWVGLVFLAMDIVYVVGFRNASYIHDYASFFLVVPVAIYGGMAVEAFLGVETCGTAAPVCGPSPDGRGGKLTFFATDGRAQTGAAVPCWQSGVGRCLAVAVLPGVLVIALAIFGWRGSMKLRDRFSILEWDTPGPVDLASGLGRVIGEEFPEGTEVLCNFQPGWGPYLDYYSQRRVWNSLVDSADWESWIASMRSSRKPVGGVVWLGAPGAREILKRLPAAECVVRKVCGIEFCFWHSSRLSRGPS